MNTITLSQLQPVIRYQGTAALTIYLPTHRFPSPANMREDQIRFKNALRTAENLLEQHKINKDEADAILSGLTDIQDAPDFWHQLQNGLVIFAEKDKYHAFTLPFECEEHISVGSQFDVTMALAVCSFDQPYYLVSLAVHNPRLFKGDITGLTPVAHIELPESPEAALNIDEMFINSNTVRGVSTGGGGNGKLSSHGQGDSREAGNEERLTFFRMIDSMLTDTRKIDQSLPLLIAGIDSEVAEYKAVSKYSNILDTHLSGNHTSTQLNELHDLSWKCIAEEAIGRQRTALIERFNNLIGADKSSVDIKSIKEAAKTGRVDALMVAALAETRDTVTDKDDSVIKLTFPKWYKQQHINDLALRVLSQGGSVVGFVAGALPKGNPIAATYRY